MKKIVFLLPLFLISCFSRPPVNPSADNKITEIVILHWNDFHSANNPYEIKDKDGNKYEVGGYAFLAGYLDSLRGLYKNVLVLNAGDDFQGTPISSITRGKSQLTILNAIHPDAFTPGNHEFDYGVESLTDWLAQADFPVVSANIVYENNNRYFTRPYVMNQYGEIDVAVIGMMSPDLKGLTVPEATKGLKITDFITTSRKFVSTLKDTAELTIVLSHMGVYQDSVLAANVRGIDFIIGGHSHTILEQPKKVKETEIFQAGSRGRYLGFLDVKINDSGDIVDEQYQLIPILPNKIRPNQLIAQLVDSLNQIEGASMDEVIGELVIPWERNYNGESNLGNWLCDVMREKLNCDIAIQNNGGIRKNLPAGEIKVRDIWEISPFGNHFVKFRLTGAEIKRFLEYQISRRGLSIQISGLRFVYDSSKKSLVSAEINGEPLDEKKAYTIVTNNYVAGQFEKYFGFPPENIEFSDTGVIDRDLFLEAVREQGRIESRKDGRIRDISAP